MRSRYLFGIDSNNIFPGIDVGFPDLPHSDGSKFIRQDLLANFRTLPPGVVGVNSTVRDAGAITLMPLMP